MAEEIKLPKTIYGFPVNIKRTCPPDKIFLIPHSILTTKEWIFPHQMKLTKEIRKSLKKMICLQK